MATIGTLYLENQGTSALAAGIATFGYVFTSAQLSANAGMEAVVGTSTVPVQVIPKNYWPNGNVKFAQLAVSRPAMATGAIVTAVMSDVAFVTASAANDLTGKSCVLKFQCSAVAVGVTISVDILSSVTWDVSGPLVSQYRYVNEPTSCSMRLIADVNNYANGGLKIDVIAANDRAMELVGGTLQYNMRIVLNTVTVVASLSVTHHQYRKNHWSVATTVVNGGQGTGSYNAGWLHIRHSDTYLQNLIELGVVANYDMTLAEVSSARLVSFQDAVTSTTWQGSVLDITRDLFRDQEAAGGRGELGISTQCNGAWVIYQDPWAAAYSLGQADVANGITWHYWDSLNDCILHIGNYYNLWVDGRGADGGPTPGPGVYNSWGLTQQHEGLTVTGWWADPAHEPDLSFIPYIMTAERWLYDNIISQASWSILEYWPFPRENGNGIMFNTEGGQQIRAAAWSMRQIENAAWAAQSGTAEETHFNIMVDNNWNWLLARLDNFTSVQGSVYGYLPLEAEYKHTPPWQQNYVASMAAVAAQRGRTEAVTYLEWAKNFMLGMLLNDPDFNPKDAAQMEIRVKDLTTGTVLTTWAEVGEETVATGNSHGTTAGDWNPETLGEYGRITMAALSGLYKITGDPDVVTAYRIFEGVNYPGTETVDFANQTEWALRIPADVTVTASVSVTVTATVSVTATATAPVSTTPGVEIIYLGPVTAVLTTEVSASVTISQLMFTHTSGVEYIDNPSPELLATLDILAETAAEMGLNDGLQQVTTHDTLQLKVGRLQALVHQFASTFT